MTIALGTFLLGTSLLVVGPASTRLIAQDVPATTMTGIQTAEHAAKFVIQRPTGNTDNIVTVAGGNFAAAAFAQEGTPNQRIFVRGAQANPDNTLTITGQNFGNGAPIVNLDGSVLTVLSNSDTQIIAQLSGELAPGTHMLTVSAGWDSTELAAINLRIGPVEPDRHQGPPGPAELRISGLNEYSLGHFAEAKRLLDRAMALAITQNDILLIGLIHDGLGDIYQNQFEYAKAEKEFRKAVDSMRRQPDHPQVLAMSLTNLAAALSGEGRYREASAFLTEASKLIKNKAVKDPLLQLHILNVLGVVYSRERQLKKAEALLLKALRMNLPADNLMILEVAAVFNNLATVYAGNGNYQKAVASYTRALQLTEERLGPSHPNLTTYMENLGFAYIHMGRYEEAESQFLGSLAILEENGLTASTMAVDTLYGLGRTSMEKNQLDRAETLLARAVETGHAIRAQTSGMVETLELYGKLLRTLSRYSEAENMDTEAFRIRAELALTTRAGY